MREHGEFSKTKGGSELWKMQSWPGQCGFNRYTSSFLPAEKQISPGIVAQDNKKIDVGWTSIGGFIAKDREIVVEIDICSMNIENSGIYQKTGEVKTQDFRSANMLIESHRIVDLSRRWDFKWIHCIDPYSYVLVVLWPNRTANTMPLACSFSTFWRSESVF